MEKTTTYRVIGFDENGKEILQKLNQVEDRSVFDYNPFYWNLVPIIILYKYVIDK